MLYFNDLNTDYIISLDENGSLNIFHAYRNNDEDYIIMQHTGLKDKKCREIYEGDIVKYKEKTECEGKITEKICMVKYTRYGFTPFIFERDVWEDCWYTIKISDIEIIGNIYENPELLKEGKKT